jgi:hypothetical protein
VRAVAVPRSEWERVVARKNPKSEQVCANVVELGAYRQRRLAREYDVDAVEGFGPAMSMAEFETGELTQEGPGYMAMARRATMLVLTRSSTELIGDGDSFSASETLDTVRDYIANLEAQLALAESSEARLLVASDAIQRREATAIMTEDQRRQASINARLRRFMAAMKAHGAATRPMSMS